MAPADRLSALCELAHWASPLVLLAVVCTATAGTFNASRSHARNILAPAWAGGLLAALIGSFLLESPAAGDRDFALFFFYPFVFCRWFVGGFAPLWLWANLRHREVAGHAGGAMLGIVAAIGLAAWTVTATVTLVVPQMYERDVAYWNRVLDPATPAINLDEARTHLSHVGRARIQKLLRDRPHTVQSEVLRGLDQLGIKQVLTAKQVSPDVVAAATATIPKEGPLSPFDIHTMMELAKNPALDDATFQLLCERGDDRVFSVLARNQGISDMRLQLLLREVQQRIAQAEKNPRTIEAARRSWRALARRIEARRAQATPPATSTAPPEDR